MYHFFTRFISNCNKLTTAIVFLVAVSINSGLCFANMQHMSFGRNHFANTNAFRHHHVHPQVLDHIIPDKCSKSRKMSYKMAMSSIVICATAAAACATVIGCVMGGDALLAACGGVAITFGIYMGEYDHCCNTLKGDFSHGWTKQMLQSAAMCSSCMSKNDVVKDICNT